MELRFSVVICFDAIIMSGTIPDVHCAAVVGLVDNDYESCLLYGMALVRYPSNDLVGLANRSF